MGFFINVVGSIVNILSIWIPPEINTNSPVWGYLHTQIQVANLFGIISGVTFSLIGCCWCCSYRWSKRSPNERSFTVRGCWSIFLIMLLVCCTVVMSVLLYENNTLNAILNDYYVDFSFQLLIQIIAVATLGTVLMTFLVCSCICYFYKCL